MYRLCGGSYGCKSFRFGYVRCVPYLCSVYKVERFTASQRSAPEGRPVSVELVYCTSLDAASAILSDGFPDGDVWSPHLPDGFADEAILEVEFDDLEEEDL